MRSCYSRFCCHSRPKEEQTAVERGAFIECFNKTYRDEEAGAYVFETIDQVQTITDD